MQQQLHPLWPWAGLRRALYVLLLLLSETRRPLLLASPSASAKVSKTRMEIREQDFSFSDGARERPAIEVVTKDVRTADIFNIMQGTGALVGPWRSCLALFADEQYAVALCIYAAIQGEVEEPVEEQTSWWKDAVTEEFSRQDVLVLALITLCVLRLMVFMIQVTWKLVKLPMQWYGALDKEEEEDEEGIREKNSEQSTKSSERKQLTIVRFCHLQFLLVVEKLKREMRSAKMENTQQMVASLEVSQHEDGKEVTLAEILATLRKIQAKDSSFKASEVEEHLQDIKQGVDNEEDADAGLPEAWTRLQEIYASFLRIQATIIRRQQRKRKWEWQLKQHEQSSQRCKRRLHSNEDPTEEVLQELQELTKELPQGFTADMFTSLGNAMHESTAAAEPETSPACSSQMEIKPTSRAADKTHTSSVCA